MYDAICNWRLEKCNHWKLLSVRERERLVAEQLCANCQSKTHNDWNGRRVNWLSHSLSQPPGELCITLHSLSNSESRHWMIATSKKKLFFTLDAHKLGRQEMEPGSLCFGVHTSGTSVFTEFVTGTFFGIIVCQYIRISYFLKIQHSKIVARKNSPNVF